jgi:hypothetical protein
MPTVQLRLLTMPQSKFGGISKSTITHTMRRRRCQREVLPAAKQQDRIRAGDSKRRTGMQGNIDLELMRFIILTLPTALAASNQDLINSMMVHDDQLVTYDVPFSEGTSSTPRADLGCDDDIDYEIFTEMASQMADSKG